MRARYAEKTSVKPHRSIEEIDHILSRYGATQFATGRDDEGRRAIISFRINNIAYKIEIPIPDKSEFAFSGAGFRKRKRTPLQIDQAFEQAYRQRWRALALVIKAKLEASAAGISTIEQEFMPNILLPGGITVRDYLIPQLNDAYTNGKMPLALPFFERSS